MIKLIIKFLPLLIIIGVPSALFAQSKDRVDVFTSVKSGGTESVCERFEPGAPVESVYPEFPARARAERLGGAVKVIVAIGLDGRVSEIRSLEGPPVFRDAARVAALKTEFTDSKCDGKKVEMTGILTFNFVPLALTDVYVVPEKAEDFADVDANSPYYESLLTLTENYQLAFGYADGKYHPAAPLTKGDFAHYLRRTLDLLQNRAEVARKIPREIGLYSPQNELGIQSAEEIADLDSRKPYSASVGFLIAKYDIALVDERKNFKGNLPMTRNEVIASWTIIFGVDTVPVNFRSSGTEDLVMTRGEFALFLHESLYVLTYKVLP
ncbi:MAG: hypothetical protein HKN33_14945 [Pyrinomonadaceae bacterium]|nr:hypothetical protein [Pyrinomonadaceae bacterium]